MLVADEWRPDASYLAPIRDEARRALVAGLLRRVPAERWGEDEVRRWLAGDDPRIVVSGLRLLGENAADAPFSIDGENVYTAGSLAAVLLRSWDTGALRSDALMHWLRGFNPTAAGQIERAGQMDPDAGLLGFCALYRPGRMPPIWRGETISAPSLAGLAARAVAGDRPARAWLLDFFQQERHAHFASLSRYEEVAALVDTVRRTRREHREAWSGVANAGGPNQAPDDDESWVQAVLIACSPIGAAERAAALSELFDPILIMRRAEWFFVFGTDPDRIGPSQLFVLRSLRDELAARCHEHRIPRRSPRARHRGASGGARAPGDPETAFGRVVGAPGRARGVSRFRRHVCTRTHPRRRPAARLDRGRSLGPGARPARGRRSQAPDAGSCGSPSGCPLRPPRSRPPRAAGEDEIHLAMVSWSGAGPNARLVLADPGPLPFATRLKVPVPGRRPSPVGARQEHAGLPHGAGSRPARAPAAVHTGADRSKASPHPAARGRSPAAPSLASRTAGQGSQRPSLASSPRQAPPAVAAPRSPDRVGALDPGGRNGSATAFARTPSRHGADPSGEGSQDRCRTCPAIHSRRRREDSILSNGTGTGATRGRTRWRQPSDGDARSDSHLPIHEIKRKLHISPLSSGVLWLSKTDYFVLSLCPTTTPQHAHVARHDGDLHHRTRVLLGALHREDGNRPSRRLPRLAESPWHSPASTPSAS